MVNLYLMTHAHTQIDPAVDCDKWQLSAQGRQQAQRLAAQPLWSRIHRIVVSSEPKTRLTIAPVLVQYPTLPLHEDARFDELHRPGWVESYTAQVQQAFAAPDEAAGEWEAAADALQRFLAGIRWLSAEFPDETIALIGHGLTFSLYRAHLLGQDRVDLDDWRKLSFAAVALVDPLAGELLSDFEAVAGTMGRG